MVRAGSRVTNWGTSRDEHQSGESAKTKPVPQSQDTTSLPLERTAIASGQIVGDKAATALRLALGRTAAMKKPGETCVYLHLRKRRVFYVGIGSPYLSASGRQSFRGKGPKAERSQLVNAPLSTVLRHPAFWALATWAGVHILKLNFVVATINDQLKQNVDKETADHLIDVLGAMLPFGFVALPLVATFLDRAPILAFERANLIGITYGAVLSFAPESAWKQGRDEDTRGDRIQTCSAKTRLPVP